MQILQKLFLSENLDLFTSREDLHRLYDHHTHHETDHSVSWNISHKLNSNKVFVEILNTKNEVIIPDSLKVLDNHSIEITFAEEESGTAFVFNTKQTEIINLNGNLLNISDSVSSESFVDGEPEELEILDDPELFKESSQLFSNIPILKSIFLKEDLNRFLSNKNDLHYKTNYLLFRAEESDTEWIINHNFGSLNIYVEIFDNDTNEVLIPKNTQLVDNHTLKITFSEPQKGYVFVVSPDTEEGNYFIPDIATIVVTTDYIPKNPICANFVELMGDYTIIGRPPEEEITIEWEQISGGFVSLNDYNILNPTFDLPSADDRVFRLWIDKGRETEAFSDVEVTSRITENAEFSLTRQNKGLDHYPFPGYIIFDLYIEEDDSPLCSTESNGNPHWILESKTFIDEPHVLVSQFLQIWNESLRTWENISALDPSSPTILGPISTQSFLYRLMIFWRYNTDTLNVFTSYTNAQYKTLGYGMGIQEPPFNFSITKNYKYVHASLERISVVRQLFESPGTIFAITNSNTESIISHYDINQYYIVDDTDLSFSVARNQNIVGLTLDRFLGVSISI